MNLRGSSGYGYVVKAGTTREASSAAREVEMDVFTNAPE